MDDPLFALKVLTAVAGLLGYLGQTYVLTPQVQDQFIYKDRNPLYGDIIKYTLYAMNLSLCICALCPWLKISATPLWAWAAVAFSGVVLLLHFIESWSFRRVRHLLFALPVRIVAALLITYLTQAALSEANA